MQFMARREKLEGAVVPMVTPVIADGTLDGRAVERVVDFLIAGGVSGIFVLGTTGEGASVSRADRQRLVELAVSRARGRALVYAGIGDTHPEGVDSGNEFLKAGADVIVSRPRISHPLDQLLSWYQGLLDGLDGPLIIYNMPMTTKVSIPLEVIEKLLGHPKLVGMKDSENNPERLEELFRRFGGRPDFAIFVGVGALMARGLKLGAAGIVPSVGNLIPEVCQNLCTSARRGDWTEAENHYSRMNTVSALYQKGRTLNESLTMLKGAMSCRGLCLPHVLPPLRAISETELASLRSEMSQLQLLNGKP
jgi:dihydrodipicolinate synthase/N-acetylneuraminate lyase